MILKQPHRLLNCGRSRCRPAPWSLHGKTGGRRLDDRCNVCRWCTVSADPQRAAWRLARAGKWERFEGLLRKSPAARTFIRMLPYQMYFDGYQRAEHIARAIDAQEAASRDAGEGGARPRT